jgi:hypothetical protein
MKRSTRSLRRLVAMAAIGAGTPAFAAPLPANAPAEVQINVCGDPRQVAAALDLRVDPIAREVWYFDTADRSLFSRGIVLRLRLGKGAPELTMKVARQDCTALPAGSLPRGEGKCEYDWHGDIVHGAVSLSRALTVKEGTALREGRTPLAAVLSAAQTRFLRERLGIWPLPPGIVPIGPATLRAYRPAKGRYSVEVWELPAGGPYVEMSRKSTNAEAPRVREELLALLSQTGVEACTDQASRAEDKLRVLGR